MTPNDTAALLALLSATYPGLVVLPETLSAWALALGEADTVEVRASALRFIRGQVLGRNHAFPPSSAEILADVAEQRIARGLADEARKRATRLALESGERTMAAQEAEFARGVMAQTGYRDWLAYLADKRAGKLADPADAPHRAWDALRNRVVDTRRRPTSGDERAA